MNSYGSVWNALAVLGERSAESFLVLIQINVGWHFGRRNCFVAARHEASDLSVNQMFFLRIEIRGLYDKERRSPHKSPSVRVKLEFCIWTYGGRTHKKGARPYLVHGSAQPKSKKTELVQAGRRKDVILGEALDFA